MGSPTGIALCADNDEVAGPGRRNHVRFDAPSLPPSIVAGLSLDSPSPPGFRITRISEPPFEKDCAGWVENLDSDEVADSLPGWQQRAKVTSILVRVRRESHLGFPFVVG